MGYLRSGPARGYRIADCRYPILDGGGSATYGSRWTSPAHHVVYAANSYEGAMLEKLVHCNIGVVPANQVSAEIDVPPELVIEELENDDLPPGWQYDERLTRRIGDRWCLELRTAVLIVPSAVARHRDAKNLIINTRHPDFKRITAMEPRAVDWDTRLFQRNGPALLPSLALRSVAGKHGSWRADLHPPGTLCRTSRLEASGRKCGSTRSGGWIPPAIRTSALCRAI